MRVAVIGVGHLGRQHARLYAELSGVELTGVVDIQKPRAEEIAGLYKTTPFTFSNLRLDLQKNGRRRLRIVLDNLSRPLSQKVTVSH